MKSRSLAIMFVTFFVGCGHGQLSTLPIVEDFDNASTVTVIRPSALFGGGASQIVALDDQKIALMKNGSNVTFRVAPGNHALAFFTVRPLCVGGGWALADRKEEDFKPRERYYAKINVGAFAGPALTFLSKEEGEQLQRETEALELSQ